MPVLVPIVIAVASAAAAYGGAYAAVSLGIAATMTAFSAVVAGALVGSVVAYAGAAMAASLMGKPGQSDGVNAADEAKRTIRSAIAPRRIVYGKARVSGPLIYVASTGDKKQYLHVVIPLADHAVEAIDTVWLNEYQITNSQIDASGAVIDGRFKNKVRIKKHLGTQTTADADLVAESPDGWSSADKLTGIAYLYLRLEFDAEIFSQGIPSISAEVRGKKVYDPRTTTTAYSDNWALCILDYLRGEHGLECTDAEIDFDLFETAANLSDENVVIDTSSNTQKRYTLNGTFTLDREPINVIEEMLASGGGALVYVAGQYRIYGGAYEAPEVTLTESDFAAPIEVVTKPPRRESFNSVRGTFINPDSFWQASEFPPVQNTSYITEDGEEVWRELNLAWITDPIRAQRIAKQLLLRSRQGVSIKAAVKYENLNLAVWQTVSITLADLGWSAKPFRVIGWALDLQTGLITLSLQEEQAASYAWIYDEASNIAEIPDTTLVDPFSVPAPAGLEMAESLYQTRDGAGVRTKVRLTWGASASVFVTGYEIQFKTASDTVWVDVGSGASTAHDIEDLAAGTYDFRVRAVSMLARSQWTTVRRFVGALAAEPPADVTGLALQSVGGMAFLRWDRHPDLDVRIGGRYEVRHTPATSAPSWGDGTTIGDAINGDATFHVLPLLSGSYLIKAIDAGGVYSSNASVIQTTQATALSFSNLSTQTEHSAFSGTKTNTTVASGKLKLSSGQNTGSYNFAAGIDLTTVKNVRLTRQMRATVINEVNLWDSRTDLMDDWLTTDDVVIGGEADAWVEVRQTDDNPSGTPTWSDWRRLDASEFRARAFQFRAQLRRYNAIYNIEIIELQASADEVV